MKHILDLFAHGSEDAFEENNFVFETYSNRTHVNSSFNEPLQEDDDDYDWDDYDNLLDKYK